MIFIFGGTTEGRKLCEFAAENGIEIFVSVVSEYGVKMLPDSEYVNVLNKRLDEEAMKEVFEVYDVSLVIDATHPYAKEVSRNIEKACESSGIKRCRVIREESRNTYGREFDTLDEIIYFLNEADKSKDNIFVTTGSKELKNLTKINDYNRRCVLRVLDVPEIVEECVLTGFDREKIIAERGPFDYRKNYEAFEKAKCKYLITKESGETGGFSEKINAARDLNMEVLILKRPKESGVSLDEMKKIISEWEAKNE